MLTISRLAALARVKPDTLRYYEREGLISPPDKSATGYRLYGKNEIAAYTSSGSRRRVVSR